MKKLKLKHSSKTKYIIISIIIVIISIIASGLINLSQNHIIPLNFNSDKLNGIDVSSHNGNIDWNIIKDNVDFAFIRVGYRGYESGSINADKKADQNLRHANKHKIPVGVYFYSQATTEQEAIEEAKFALNMVKWHDISLPIIIDFEYAQDENGDKVGRLYDAELNNRERTNIINAFCKTIRDAGYKYGVYASANVYSFQLNSNDLIDGCIKWVAHYSDELKYTYDIDIWQYSRTGKMDGISSQYVDLDYWFYNKENPTEN